MVAHTYNSRLWENEAGNIVFKASLNSILKSELYNQKMIPVTQNKQIFLTFTQNLKGLWLPKIILKNSEAGGLTLLIFKHTTEPPRWHGTSIKTHIWQAVKQYRKPWSKPLNIQSNGLHQASKGQPSTHSVGKTGSPHTKGIKLNLKPYMKGKLTINQDLKPQDTPKKA